jgi:hypothetical protein
MQNRLLYVVSLIAVALIAAAESPATSTDRNNLVVHEWGTFTAVAGADGRAVVWRPFGGPTDLPCFVQRFGSSKGSIWGTVRMETPVLYFYNSRETKLNVSVDFPQGLITEWYPRAAVTPAYFMDGDASGGSVAWRDVKVSPGVTEKFPVEAGESHYYAARATDAAPVQVASEREKFLFYRGVGSFDLPLTASVIGDRQIVVETAADSEISGLILFHNYNGERAHQVHGNLRGRATLDVGSVRTDFKSLSKDLTKILTEHGLYPREADAMIETWRDSWFEEGTRLFFILPEAAVDSLLPLKIEPKPAAVDRVFVGRMEILTPKTLAVVAKALADRDRQTLERYGRFLEPIAKRIGSLNVSDRSFLQSVAAKYVSPPALCGKR